MKGRPIRIVCVGKLKQDYWRAAWLHYLEACRKWRPVEVVEVKDGGGSHNLKRSEEECGRIAAVLDGRDVAIALSENGCQMDSLSFAEFLRKLDEREQKRINFIIGGPFGLTQSFLGNCVCVLSMSAMTWPHELARVMLAEQLFRALCILGNFPYHH